MGEVFDGNRPASRIQRFIDRFGKRDFGILKLLSRSRAGHSAEFTPIVVIPIEEIRCAATDRC